MVEKTKEEQLFEQLQEFSRSTDEIKAIYDSWMLHLQETKEILDSVLDNSNAAIIATDMNKGVFLKNRSAKKLIDEVTQETLFEILISYKNVGVYSFELSGRYFNLSVSSLREVNNTGFVYMIEDITKLKTLEKETLHNEKLQLMGEMAANIAHEVRNPLGAIEVYASLLARDLGDDADKKRLASSIVKGVRTINSVISNTLLFTKELKIEKSEKQLSDIVDEVVLYLQHIIRDKAIKVTNRLQGDHMVLCDENMYKQVVMNIIINACDAIKTNGMITVSASSDDRNLALSIEDNGSGIAKGMLSRLFMPFQTTKASGTGLGLSIAYKIIKAHGGDITAESNGSNYTRFTIITPNNSQGSV